MIGLYCLNKCARHWMEFVSNVQLLLWTAVLRHIKYVTYEFSQKILAAGPILLTMNAMNRFYICFRRTTIIEHVASACMDIHGQVWTTKPAISYENSLCDTRIAMIYRWYSLRHKVRLQLDWTKGQQEPFLINIFIYTEEVIDAFTFMDIEYLSKRKKQSGPNEIWKETR